MSVDPGVMRRLALIRLLLGRAEDAANQPTPYSTDAINRAHDVAEMWLALAVEIKGMSIPRDFMGYWPELEKVLGRPLAYKVQMTRLNKTRVNLKHYGIEPAPEEIKAATRTVRGLLDDETPELFGVALSEASLTTFVASEKASALLTSAEARWAEGEPDLAMADLADAFDAVIREYVMSKRSKRGGGSIFSSTTALDRPFGATWQRDRTRMPPRDQGQGRALVDWQGRVEHSITKLDETLTLVALGVDMRRYGMFNTLTPGVMWMLAGNRVIHASGEPASVEQYEFCRDFVVQTALFLAEFDYELEVSQPHSATPRTYTQRPGEPAELERDKDE